nr:zinc finger, CCHC-type [Tanacetum cinerariifolium]
MLLELKTLFAQQAEQELLQTTRDFHSCKQEEGQSVSSYVLKMKGYIDNLERLGHPVTLGFGVSLILIGLCKEFDGFVQNYNMHSLGKTIIELHAMLKLHEKTLPKNNALALHAIRAGHWKRNCPQYLAELLKKKKNASSGAGGSEPLHAHEMLKELKTLFGQQAEHELLQTTRDFHSCRQEEGQSVSSYVLKIKGYIDNLERLGHPVTLGLGVSLILIGLRKEYDGFVQNYNMHNMGKTVNELHAMLKLHEQTLPKSNAPALNAIRAGKVQKGNKHKKSHSQKGAKGQNQGKWKFVPKPKIPLPPKRENPAKEFICHECGKIGDWKRNCPQYLVELMKKKKNTTSRAGGSGIFGLRASRKLKPRALSLYVGNGQRDAVEAIGACYLCLPSGLEIVLNNCHYAPSITRGVI